jgi:hypothetical protein
MGASGNFLIQGMRSESTGVGLNGPWVAGAAVFSNLNLATEMAFPHPPYGNYID